MCRFNLIELKLQQIQNHSNNFYMGPENRNKTITDSFEQTSRSGLL